MLISVKYIQNLGAYIVSVICEILVPEIPVNIYELGLIYKIEVDEKNKVLIEMTLTSPNCPVAESLPNSVKENILRINGIKEVDLKLVRLAKELTAQLVTNDFNLTKVANLQGVRVLNVNQLANSLRPVILPGEKMKIKVSKSGKDETEVLDVFKETFVTLKGIMG